MRNCRQRADSEFVGISNARNRDEWRIFSRPCVEIDERNVITGNAKNQGIDITRSPWRLAPNFSARAALLSSVFLSRQ